MNYWGKSKLSIFFATIMFLNDLLCIDSWGIPHMYLVTSRPYTSNIELLLKLKSSIEIVRIIAASAERELQ